jgi:rod shape-determining protein MreD
MFEFIWQRFDSGARLSLPFVTALVCTLLSVIAWPVPHLGTVAPPLGLIALYYWTIHRPDLFRPWMVFVLGLLNDFINYLPLGLSALLFVAAHQLILRQRRFFAGHSFFMMWFGFILMLFIVMITEWIGLCLIRWQGVPFLPVLAQCVMAIVFFPLPCWILIYLQRTALSQN